MKVVVIHPALDELEDAVRYYGAISPELGQRLRHEFDERIAWVLQNPQTLRLREGGYRRVNLAVFPYYVPYILRGDLFWILAFAHAKRSPEYWIDRLPGQA